MDTREGGSINDIMGRRPRRLRLAGSPTLFVACCNWKRETVPPVLAAPVPVVMVVVVVVVVGSTAVVSFFFFLDDDEEEEEEEEDNKGIKMWEVGRYEELSSTVVVASSTV